MFMVKVSIKDNDYSLGMFSYMTTILHASLDNITIVFALV